MPTVLFFQEKPRMAAKVGPLLKKKGFTVHETSSKAEFEGLKVRPDLVVTDTVENVMTVIECKVAAPSHIIAVNMPPGAEVPAGVICVPGGKMVDEIIKLVGLPSHRATAPEDRKESGPAAPSMAGGAAEAATPATNIEQIIQLKIAKVRELRGRGIDPYPHRFEKKDVVDAINARAEGLAPMTHTEHELTTAGRVTAHRAMGKAIFLDLQDASGKAQVYVRQDVPDSPAFALAHNDIQIGDFVGAHGKVFMTKTGQPTLAADTLWVLAKALRPLPEKWHGLKDPETRYRQRYLDLISNPEARRLAVERSRIVESVRRTMSRLGYQEVETPILLPHAGGAAAKPFHTRHNALDADMVLRIATELYLKRLIIGGLERVYEIGRIFRNEGIDTRHNPEFTMLEAYGSYEDYHGMARLFEAVLFDAAKALGRESVEYRGQKLELKPPIRRLYLPQLWKDLCGADIHDILKGKGFDREGLLALGKKLGIEAGPGTPSAKVFERIFDAKILPELTQPAFVMDHPTAITPLAKCKPGDESLVERFEFFVGTEELANAYTELNDPLDQRERFEEQARQRKAGHDEAEMLDEDFVQAMEAGMPPTGGIGMGIDRMVMILTGTPSIREVILFPTLKPEGAA